MQTDTQAGELITSEAATAGKAVKNILDTSHS